MMNMHMPILSKITLSHPSVGRSPAGFARYCIELPPTSLGRLVGYDPRSLEGKTPRKGAKAAPSRVPGNVAQEVVDLQNRVQRSIDGPRVARMVAYLHGAAEGRFADWGAIELVTSAEPDTSHLEDRAEISFSTEADYFISDGQHRYCAILDFVREYPELAGGWTQSVTISVMPAARLAEWAGQSFHDRNYFAVAVRPGKALSVDSRDPVNALTRALDSHPAIARAGGIAYERDTLTAGDTRLTSHSVLHRFTRGFLFGRPGLDGKGDGAPTAEDAARLHTYLAALGEVLPWAGENRDEFLTRTSVVLAALAVIGHDLWHMGLSEADIGQRIARLAAVDWRRTNLAWVGVLGSEKGGRVIPASSRPAIDGLIRHLRAHLGIGT